MQDLKSGKLPPPVAFTPKGRVDAAQAALDKAKSEVTKLDEAVKSTQAEKIAAEKALAKVQQALAKMQADLAATQKRIAEAEAALKKAKDQLQKELDDNAPPKEDMQSRAGEMPILRAVLARPPVNFRSLKTSEVLG